MHFLAQGRVVASIVASIETVWTIREPDTRRLLLFSSYDSIEVQQAMNGFSL